MSEVSRIIAQNNVFNITDAAVAESCTDVVKDPNSENPEGNFVDTGSTINGAALTGRTAPTAVGWSLPGGYRYTLLSNSQVYRLATLANRSRAVQRLPSQPRWRIRAQRPTNGE